MTRFAWGVASDVGRVRSANQDSVLALEGLFAVADGMGGHRGGEVASDVAVTALREQAPILTTNDLLEAIHIANDAILTQSHDDPALRGMGTTLCVLALVEAEEQERLAIANVGDSRVYLFANGELEQMTDDHSLVAALVREGRITPEEAEAHPQRNILTRALGIDREVLVDAWEVLPFVGDRWVLCSDGLFNEVTEDQIASVLRRLAAPADAADELVRLANEGGGRDNITVLVVDIVEREGHAEIAPGARVETVDADRAAPGSPVSNGGATPARPAVAAGEGEPPAGGLAGGERRKRRATRRFTWRVGLFLVALVAVVAVGFGAVVYYARNSWYVDLDEAHGTAIIYKGRPGGVLWFDPTKVTEVPVTSLTPVQTERLKARVQLDSREAAEQYLEQWTQAATPATTTTSAPAPTAPSTTVAAGAPTTTTPTGG